MTACSRFRCGRPGFSIGEARWSGVALRRCFCEARGSGLGLEIWKRQLVRYWEL